MPVHPLRVRTLSLCIVAAGCAATAHAQNVKPPKAQLWMDVSTGSMAGMPDMDMPGGIAAMMAGRGGARGGGASTSYGMARSMTVMPPRILDIAFYNSLQPGAEASQAIPAGMRMGESLPLLPPPRRETTPTEREPSEPGEVQRPKGRILVYWGCGETVRAGQPRVIDFSSAAPSEFASVFAGRHAPERGPRVGTNYVLYPNERNTVMLARDSSLVGEHQVRGAGVPSSMKFTLGDAQDVMPPIELQSKGTLQDSIALSWAPVRSARAYYLHAMSSNGNDMVMWSSAETPDTGMGLFDFLPNATIEQWTRQRVLLGADTTSCAVPKGIFAQAAGGSAREATPMLRMIAYGGESNFAYPPRPADPKAVWEPEWAVRLRLKSHTMAMLGQEMGDARSARQNPRTRGNEPPTAAGTEQQQPPATAIPGVPGVTVNPGALLRGILGR